MIIFLLWTMINNCASYCKNCLYLLRLIMLDNLAKNQRVFAKHVKCLDNYLSDALSRMQFKQFWQLEPPGMNAYLAKISELVWPAS